MFFVKEPNFLKTLLTIWNSIKENHIKVHTSKVANFVKVKVSNSIAMTNIALEHERSVPYTDLVLFSIMWILEGMVYAWNCFHCKYQEVPPQKICILERSLTNHHDDAKTNGSADICAFGPCRCWRGSKVRQEIPIQANSPCHHVQKVSSFCNM